MNNNNHIWVSLAITLFAALAFWYVSETITSVLIFVPGILVSFIFSLKAISSTNSKTEKLIPLYLLALGIQFIHFTEEYITDFNKALPALLNAPPYPENEWIVFNMIAYSIFIIGGIALYKRILSMMVIPVFFVLIGVMMNGIAHLLLAIYVGGYFPGLFTALIYLILGPIMIIKFNKYMFHSP